MSVPNGPWNLILVCPLFLRKEKSLSTSLDWSHGCGNNFLLSKLKASCLLKFGGEHTFGNYFMKDRWDWLALLSGNQLIRAKMSMFHQLMDYNGKHAGCPERVNFRPTEVTELIYFNHGDYGESQSGTTEWTCVCSWSRGGKKKWVICGETGKSGVVLLWNPKWEMIGSCPPFPLVRGT